MLTNKNDEDQRLLFIGFVQFDLDLPNLKGSGRAGQVYAHFLFGVLCLLNYHLD